MTAHFPNFFMQLQLTIPISFDDDRPRITGKLSKSRMNEIGHDRSSKVSFI